MIRVEVVEPFGEWWDAVERDPDFQHWIRPDLDHHRQHGWTIYKHQERNYFIKAAKRFAGMDKAIEVRTLEQDLYRRALANGVWIKVVTLAGPSGKFDIFRPEYRGSGWFEFEGRTWNAIARPSGPSRWKTWGLPPEMTWPWHCTHMCVYGWIEFYALP